MLEAFTSLTRYPWVKRGPVINAWTATQISDQTGLVSLPAITERKRPGLFKFIAQCHSVSRMHNSECILSTPMHEEIEE